MRTTYRICLAILTLCAGLSSTALAQQDLVFSYVLHPTGNQTAINPGGVLQFSPARTDQTATATFTVTNRTGGPVTATQAVIAGEGFAVSGLPLFPHEFTTTWSFTVIFRPTRLGAHQGSVSLMIRGIQRTFLLEGTGLAPRLVYELTTGDQPPIGIAPNSVVSLRSTPVGATEVATVRVTNTGNAEARITRISISGRDLRVTSAPILPATIEPGQWFAVSFTFSPTQSGGVEGQLLIESAVFRIEATGIGAELSFAYTLAGVTTNLNPNGTVLFPSVPAGTRAHAVITVRNRGNAGTVLTILSIAALQFRALGAPVLPLSIGPGAEVSFTVEFVPDRLGSLTGQMQLNEFTFTLRGLGVNPMPLPATAFIDVAESISALDQPGIKLGLVEPYGADISGVLTLEFESDTFVNDPAVQFATGGRTVAFKIPRGTTAAIFGEDRDSVPYQAGTVAGTIRFRTTYSVGVVDATPSPAPSKSVLVRPGPPELRRIQIGSRTAAGFEVLVSGFSTTRTVNTMRIQFTAAPGHSLATTVLDVNASGPFSAWYENPASRTYGSQFTASIFINVSGSIDAVASVAVTASNASGSSGEVGVPLR